MTTLENIEQILAHGRFSELIGVKEDLWFEAKQIHEFNDLANNPRQRFELSKDVSAMANSEGGFILFGLRTEPILEERTDQVIELDLFGTDEFNASQFMGVTTGHIFPRIRGLRMAWVESAESNGRGIGCISVPSQDPEDLPFLLNQVYEGDDQLHRIVFGVASRVGSSNVPLTIEGLHRAVRQGRASVPERLTRIEERLAELVGLIGQPTPGAERRFQAEELPERIRRVLENG